LYGISSEVQSSVDEAYIKWKLGGFTSVIGDNNNTLTQFLRQHYLPKLVITDCSDKHNPNGLNAKDYPQGAVQPALLIFVGTKPAIAWATQPTAANLQGSLNRPDPKAVWKVVEQAYKKQQKGLDFQCSDGTDLDQTANCIDLVRADCGCTIM
jgi:hypothetical protein